MAPAPVSGKNLVANTIWKEVQTLKSLKSTYGPSSRKSYEINRADIAVQQTTGQSGTTCEWLRWLWNAQSILYRFQGL
jgi:hypothetical protein